MITREQYLRIMLNSYCKDHAVDDSYKAGFIEGAHQADDSLLSFFKNWVHHSKNNFIFHERGFIDEESVINSFKSFLGYE